MQTLLCSAHRRCGISPKKLLIPMSFATVLGGTCTLIGTSTNLVVAGLQEAKYGTKNPENVFGFFTITPWGLPYAIWVSCFVLLGAVPVTVCVLGRLQPLIVCALPALRKSWKF
jgi:di/tricarboxylate transporter